MPLEPDDRIVISGIGAFCAAGSSIDQIWENLLAGKSFVREYADPLFNSWPGRMLAAGVPTENHAPQQNLVLKEALRTSRLELPADDVGFVFGASKGRLVAPMKNTHSVDPQSTLSNHPFAPLAPNSSGDILRTDHHIHGNATCPVAACASGLVALIQAARWIEWKQCRSVIAGSSDFSICPVVMASYRRLGVLSHWDGPAEAACRPFDRRRSGFVIGEGAGIIVLKSESEARRRSATPLAIWSGHDHRTDPTGLIDSDPAGEVIGVVVKNAIDHAKLMPHEIDAICCHGTGTRANDRAEAMALRRVFGAQLDKTPCFSLKGAIGHTLGASGSLEIALCARALQEQTLPPHQNADEVDPECPIGPLAADPLDRPLRHILKLSYGFGGHVAAAVISQYQG